MCEHYTSCLLNYTLKKFELNRNPAFMHLIQYAFMMYDWHQQGIDLWRQALSLFDTANRVLDHEIEVFAEKIMTFELITQFYFALLENVHFIIMRKLDSDDSIVDDKSIFDEVIHTATSLLNKGEEAFQRWSDLITKPDEQQHQRMLSKCHLLHGLFGAQYAMFLEDNDKFLSIKEKLFPSSYVRYDRPVEGVRLWHLLQELLADMETAPVCASKDRLFWIEKLLECMCMCSEAEEYLTLTGGYIRGMHEVHKRLRRRFITPCLQWLECICQQYSQQHRRQRLISITEHIQSFSSSPTYPSSLETETVLREYVSHLLTRDLLIDKAVATTRLNEIVIQSNARVLQFLS
jgi:hypothetical protein